MENPTYTMKELNKFYEVNELTPIALKGNVKDESGEFSLCHYRGLRIDMEKYNFESKDEIEELLSKVSYLIRTDLTNSFADYCIEKGSIEVDICEVQQEFLVSEICSMNVIEQNEDDLY
jgi:hypothetical protein